MKTLRFGLPTKAGIREILRGVAWIVILALVMISLAPASLRPRTGISHNFEHFGAFLVAGVFWGFAYTEGLRLWFGPVLIFAGSIELLQLLVPGRHARFTDFVVDTLGGYAGILITSWASWVVCCCRARRSLGSSAPSRE
jgi:VanZ family protein